MIGKQLVLPLQKVIESNLLSRAKWKPASIWEARIVALIASKIQYDDEDFYSYKILLSELGVDKKLSGFQYEEIKKALLRLKKAEIYIQGQGRDFIAYSIFSKVGYQNGELLAEFHPDLKPHYLQLKSHFTQYQLLELLILPSTYSQVIFRYLMSWKSCSENIINLIELYELLNVPETLRKYTDFKRFVLDKAHRDINEKTSLNYEWEPLKIKNKVTALRFTFSRTKQNKIINKRTKELTDKFISAQARPGETWEEARERLSNKNKQLF